MNVVHSDELVIGVGRRVWTGEPRALCEYRRVSVIAPKNAALNVACHAARTYKNRRVSTTLRHSDMEFSEYCRLSLWVC